MFIINGFLLGLSTGIFCLAWCGPVFMPLISAEKRKLRENFFIFGKFISGKLIGGALFGALVGYLGFKIESEIIKSINLAALIILSILLVLYGIGLLKEKKVFCKLLKKIKFPILAGFLTGVNICPPFLLGLTYIFNLGSPLKGVLFSLSFIIATSLYFIPLVFLGIFSRKLIFQKIAQVIAILAGLFFLWHGLKAISFSLGCAGCPLANQELDSGWLALGLFSLILFLASLSKLSKKYFWLRNITLAFSLIYFGFFLKNIFCPLRTLQMLFISGPKIVASLITFLFFLLPILLALIIGKIYCHWVCPLGAFQEFIFRVPKFLKLPRPKIHYPRFKYFILILIILALLIFRKPILCGIDPFGALFGRFVTPVSISFLVILIGTSLVIFRPWCQFLCPYGAILSLLSKISIFKGRKK